MAKAPKTDSEFGGGPGLILPQNYEHLTPVEELWTIYATNPGDPLAVDESSALDPARVGLPPSYEQTPKGWNHG